jgi:hypothetical protein
VTSVELEVKLSDSLLARGLEGCRLAANLESETPGRPGVNIHRGPFTEGSFWCAKDDSTSENLVEYGHAVFHPGNVTVPLLLSEGLVDELQDLDLGGDSTPPVDKVQLDSVIAAARLAADSVQKAVHARMSDSLRAEGRRRSDSIRSVVRRMADSARSR